jgi:protocatechuate 3,4-dioxygenase beta subunit
MLPGVALRREMAIAGSVVDIAGVPVTQAVVRARREGPPFEILTRITNSAGRFDFGSVLAGRYRLTASASEYGVAEATIDRSSVGTRLVVGGTGGVEGRVIDFQGNPVERYEIEIIPEGAGRPTVRRAIRDRGGVFRIKAVPPGQYSIRVKARRGWVVMRCLAPQ